MHTDHAWSCLCNLEFGGKPNIMDNYNVWAGQPNLVNY
jgi:hypothetical protein